MAKLDQKFFEQPTLDLAQSLLGCQLFHELGSQLLGGYIVETEAYLSESDPASHSARGKTSRNQAMFGPPGHLYVYSIHNRYCANIVSESRGRGAAVLLRAVEPIVGLDAMQLLRPAPSRHELTNGPGKLCQAFGFNLQQNGAPLILNETLWLERNPARLDFEMRNSPRIGISQGVELHYRFFINGNPFVSGRAKDHSIKRTRYLGDCTIKKELAS